MPLVKIEKQKEGTWALWFITETESELSFASMESVPEEIVSPQKRLEHLAGRALLKQLVEGEGLEYIGLHKDENGKPYLKNLPHHISLSHSFPYVAAQIHPSVAVGIDIEQPKEKLLRIASRVLSPTEGQDAGTDYVKHCVYWCAKEAMYKLHGRRGLHFNRQLNVEPFVMESTGILTGTISENGTATHVDLHYRVKPDYVLVYTLT